MELNGISNLKLQIDKLFDELVNTKQDSREIKKTLGDMQDQLDVLERYMVSIADYLDKVDQNVYTRPSDKPERLPYWHEVRDERDKYPTNSERLKSCGLLK